jgi:uncharacterized membrane protein YebE (DUF533 family)
MFTNGIKVATDWAGLAKNVGSVAKHYGGQAAEWVAKNPGKTTAAIGGLAAGKYLLSDDKEKKKMGERAARISDIAAGGMIARGLMKR